MQAEKLEQEPKKKRTTAKKTKNKPKTPISENELAGRVMETSKRLLWTLIILFGVQMTVSMIAIVACPELAEPLIALMRTCMLVYELGVGGYLGKAGVENVLKIRKALKAPQDANDDEQEDDGNG